MHCHSCITRDHYKIQQIRNENMKVEVMNILKNPPKNQNMVCVDFSVHECSESRNAYESIVPIIRSHGYDVIEISTEDSQRCFYIILRPPTKQDVRRIYHVYPSVIDEKYYDELHQEVTKNIKLQTKDN